MFAGLTNRRPKWLPLSFPLPLVGVLSASSGALRQRQTQLKSRLPGAFGCGLPMVKP